MAAWAPGRGISFAGASRFRNTVSIIKEPVNSVTASGILLVLIKNPRVVYVSNIVFANVLPARGYYKSGPSLCARMGDLATVPSERFLNVIRREKP